MAAEKKSKKTKEAPPKWFLNTYFWWSACLFLLTIGGILRGPGVIRDPGQKPEANLVFVYFVAGVVMLVNGILSHIQAKSAYAASQDVNAPAS